MSMSIKPTVELMPGTDGEPDHADLAKNVANISAFLTTGAGAGGDPDPEAVWQAVRGVFPHVRLLEHPLESFGRPMFDALASSRALASVVVLAVQALETSLSSEALARVTSDADPAIPMAGRASHILLILLGGETTPRPAMLRYETSRKQAEAQYRSAARDRRRRASAAAAQEESAADAESSPTSVDAGDGADAGAGDDDAALAERAANAAAAAVPLPHSHRSILTHRAVHTICSTAAAALGDGAAPPTGPPTDAGTHTLISRICHACASHAARAAPRARGSDPEASALLMNTGALLSLLLYSSRVPAGPQAAARRFIADDSGVGGTLRRVMHDLTLWWERGCRRAAELGSSCLGCAVWVHWPADGTWYRGRVVHFSPSSLHHTVRYAQDASCESLVLGRVHHALLPHAPTAKVAQLAEMEESSHQFRTLTQPPVVGTLLEPSRRVRSLVDVEAAWLCDSNVTTPAWLWRADSATERQWVRPLLDTLLQPRGEALGAVPTDSAQLSRVVEQLNTSPWLASQGNWDPKQEARPASPAPSSVRPSSPSYDAPTGEAASAGSAGLEDLAAVLVKLCGEAADTGVPRELLKGRRGVRGRSAARAQRSPTRGRRARGRGVSRFGPGDSDDQESHSSGVRAPRAPRTSIPGARRLRRAPVSPFVPTGAYWEPPHPEGPGLFHSSRFAVNLCQRRQLPPYGGVLHVALARAIRDQLMMMSHVMPGPAKAGYAYGPPPPPPHAGMQGPQMAGYGMPGGVVPRGAGTGPCYAQQGTGMGQMRGQPLHRGPHPQTFMAGAASHARPPPAMWGRGVAAAPGLAGRAATKLEAQDPRALAGATAAPPPPPMAVPAAGSQPGAHPASQRSPPLQAHRPPAISGGAGAASLQLSEPTEGAKAAMEVNSAAAGTAGSINAEVTDLEAQRARIAQWRHQRAVQLAQSQRGAATGQAAAGEEERAPAAESGPPGGSAAEAARSTVSQYVTSSPETSSMDARTLGTAASTAVEEAVSRMQEAMAQQQGSFDSLGLSRVPGGSGSSPDRRGAAPQAALPPPVPSPPRPAAYQGHDHRQREQQLQQQQQQQQQLQMQQQQQQQQRMQQLQHMQQVQQLQMRQQQQGPPLQPQQAFARPHPSMGYGAGPYAHAMDGAGQEAGFEAMQRGASGPPQPSGGMHYMGPGMWPPGAGQPSYERGFPYGYMSMPPHMMMQQGAQQMPPHLMMQQQQQQQQQQLQQLQQQQLAMQQGPPQQQQPHFVHHMHHGMAAGYPQGPPYGGPRF